MKDKTLSTFTDVSMSRKTFLRSAGRFSLLFSLLGLGGFLFSRNTCHGSDVQIGSGNNPCGACRKNDDCDLSQAEMYRTAQQPIGHE